MQSIFLSFADDLWIQDWHKAIFLDFNKTASVLPYEASFGKYIFGVSPILF